MFIYNSSFLLESGRYLTCGGQDEKIKIYNMVDKRAMGDVSSFAHSGAITCLEFFQDSYLISGSDVIWIVETSFLDFLLIINTNRTVLCVFGEQVIGNVFTFLVAIKVRFSLLFSFHQVIIIFPAGINGISIHPTGKMSLSVSKDGTMKLWNLVQGYFLYLFIHSL